MTRAVVSVGYRYVYDLYYRTRRARLEHEAYSLEFLDWCKAGVAYNVLGKEEPGRKVAYFSNLYSHLSLDDYTASVDVLRQGVAAFYEDLFKLYQDHLTAQLKASKRRGSEYSLEPQNLILLPSFSKTPGVYDILPHKEIIVENYQCVNLDALRDKVATIYASEDSTLFKCMALYFDMSQAKQNEVALVGVTM